ncbi:hypothetical protein [Nocardia brasiliensis]|uniref:hypothetical protein n=1 Tax=Nocardia brasiliensis TaxID=37326 RepID=UPI0024582AF7|nr:hypothetical protein [Nocardia brasiliensis]
MPHTPAADLPTNNAGDSALPTMNTNGHEINSPADLIGHYITFIGTNGIVVAGVRVQDLETETGRLRVHYTLPGGIAQSAMPLSSMGFLYVHYVQEPQGFVLPTTVHAGEKVDIRGGIR